MTTQNEVTRSRSASDVSRDEGFIYDSMRRRAEACADLIYGNIDDEMNAIKEEVNSDGALERLIKDNVQRLKEDGADQEALHKWLSYFHLYLEYTFSESFEQFYDAPLDILSDVIDGLGRGVLHPLLRPTAITNRPPDPNYINEIKIRSVLAADICYEAHKAKGDKISRDKADGDILKRKDVEKAIERLDIKRLGPNPIKGWRKKINKYSPDCWLYSLTDQLKSMSRSVLEKDGQEAAVSFLLDKVTDVLLSKLLLGTKPPTVK